MTTNTRVLNSVILSEGESKITTKILKSNSLWIDALGRIAKDKMALASLIIVLVYGLVAILSALGIIAADWGKEVGDSYAEPSSQFWLGTDIFGRDVLTKVIHGTQVAMSVGLVSSLIAIPIGVSLGTVVKPLPKINATLIRSIIYGIDEKVV